MRRLALALAALAVLAWAGPAAGPAAARAKLINPCNFSDLDSPCKLHDGVYRALLPQGNGPHPAVIYLYGSLGISGGITRNTYFRDEVVRRGYALIVPAALDVMYVGNQRGTGWGRAARRSSHPRDDMDFLRRVIADAQQRHNIDPKRLILAGQSDGGFMIWEIACHNPGMAAAFAVHAASYGGVLPRQCSRPVRFLQTHGLNDSIVPFEGGLRIGPHVAAADVSEGLAVLARTNRCRKGPEQEPAYFGFDRRGWRDCAQDSALDLLIHRGGHFPPSGWMPAVLDWFEASITRPATAVTRRVGQGVTGLPGTGGVAAGRFKSVSD